MMFVHIGLPKCASTSLQQAFKSVEQIRYLGCDSKAAPAQFFHDNIGDFLDTRLRLGSNHSFHEKSGEIRSFLDALTGELEVPLVLSYENISLRSTPWDLPTDIKYQRLSQFLPKDIHILFIYRPVKDLLTSLYKNYLQIGYTGSLGDFCDEICVLGGHGILGDLCLREQHSRLSNLFSENQLQFFTTENLQKPLTEYFENHQIALPDLKNENQGLRNSEISAALDFNLKRIPNKTLTNWLELHRFGCEQKVSEEQRFYLSRYRHEQINYVRESKKLNSSPEAFDWPDKISSLDRSNQGFFKEMGC